jgi:hypothetical protein
MIRTGRTTFMSLVLLVTLACSSAEKEQWGEIQPAAELTAHPTDGKGSAVLISEQQVRAGDWGSWKVLFFPGEDGIETRGGILFQVSPFWSWSMPQTRRPEGAGYTTVESTNKEVKFELIESDFHFLQISIEEGRLSAGDTVTIVYGDTVRGTFPYSMAKADKYAERDEQFLIKVDGNGDNLFIPIPESPTINILARDAVKLVAYVPSLVAPGDVFTCRVSALDGFGNRDRRYRGTIEILVRDTGLEVPRIWEFLPADSGSVEIPVEAAGVDAVGTHLIEVRTPDGQMTAVSNPVKCGESESGYRLFWGDLHGHSELTDGSAQPDEFYSYARDVAGLDVTSLTDHDAHGFLPIDEHEELWDLIKTTTGSFYEPGKFVTLLGYEWTSWTYGHRHILYPGSEGEVFSFRDSVSDTPEELWELVKPYGGIVIPHHPGGGPIGIDWDHHDDLAEPLVEICSVHGNSDHYGCQGQIYRPEKGSFVQDALERGFRLGILGSGDTHDGHPGRRSAGYPSMGMAGLWARELTRAGIWEALLAKRVYGTSGARIILEFEIDGHLMGESFSPEGEAEKTITVRAIGTAEIDRLEILENAEVIFRDAVGAAEVELHQTHIVKPGAYYRVRLYQADGEMAWSSPIWCDGG